MEAILQKYQKDPNRLMDILIDVQSEKGCVSEESRKEIAKALNISKVDVEQTMSFYHFFTTKPAKYNVFLNDSAVANFKGREQVAEAFEKETDAEFGCSDGKNGIVLHNTADIGMNDQEVAALINGKVFTNLDPGKVREIVTQMKEGKAVEEMIKDYGDGKNAELKSMVKNNIMNEGKVLFTSYETGTAINKIKDMSPEDIVAEVKNSNIRGRGGAGFPTGLKWDFTLKAEGEEKYVICNADEGEPGTFKDRVLLTEYADRCFEGMAVAGKAIKAKEGIIYLRAEYNYLKKHLEDTINNMSDVLGDFKIRIQMGAGAYVCGEETSLIESAEGKRGEPRNKPPFPAQAGYMQKPTVVNNVETFAAVCKIMEKGADWYKEIGTEESSGTKLLSISGDCNKPGVYEVDYGMTINEMLEMVDGKDAQAVQIAGPSGVCINPSQFNRKVAFEDLPTGGSMIVVGKQRDLLKELSLNFMEFFVDESCGSCVTCRAFGVIAKKKLEKLIAGNGIKQDIADLKEMEEIMKNTTRCGLGQTAINPIATTIANFSDLYDKLAKDVDYHSEFDLAAAVADSCDYVGREPNL